MHNVQLDIKGLLVGYNTPLLASIDLQISGGSLVIITGENGSGKSTFLKHLAGIETPISGQIIINQTPLSKYSVAERAQLMALVLNQKIDEPYITVEDIVKMGRYAQYQSIVLDQNVEEAIKLMKIEHIRHKYLNQISDGEWQKTNVARAIAQNTPIILLDEPTAFLDYPSKIALFKDLKQIALAFNKIILVSTHDIHVCKNEGTRFWHIQNGVLTDNTQSVW